MDTAGSNPAACNRISGLPCVRTIDEAVQTTAAVATSRQGAATRKRPTRWLRWGIGATFTILSGIVVFPMLSWYTYVYRVSYIPYSIQYIQVKDL